MPGRPRAGGAATSTFAATAAKAARARATVTDVARRASEALAPVTRRLEPVTQVFRWVSPLGWSVLAGALIAWWVGVRYGWTELLMVAGAAFVLLLACLLLAIGRTRVTIDAEVNPDRVVVGDPATGRIIVGNTGSVPVLPILVELPVGQSAARFVLPPLGSGTEHEELFVVPTHRRGVIPVGPASTIQGDPLGLIRRTVNWTEVTELFVHPRTVALDSLGAGLLRDLEGSVTEEQSMSDLAFHALRDYQPGDDRRYIHWRSSAKAGRLLVRQFLDTRRSHVCVVVDPDAASYRGGSEAIGEITASRTVPVPGGALPEVRDLETALSVAGSIAVRCFRDDQDATVVSGPYAVSKGTPQRTLDTLARVEATAYEISAMVATAAALAPDTSVCFVVTGPFRDFRDIQRATSHFGPEVSFVVIVVDPHATRSVRRAGGLRVLTIDALRSLRAALATGVAA